MLEHSTAKDMVVLEADTAELFLFQGRVVEVLMDMGMLAAVEHSPLEGVRRDSLLVAE